MNIASWPAADLEIALAGSLRVLLVGVDWLKGWTVDHPASGMRDQGVDLVATLPMPTGGKAVMYVSCKAELRPSQFRNFAERPFQPTHISKTFKRVLALPWVSPRMRDLCETHDWGWFDLAGNCRLSIPGLLHLERTGNPPVHTPPRPSAKLSSAAAGRVIRALLIPDNAGMHWTQRSMQNHCEPNVSLGLVNKVVRFLHDEAFIETTDDGFRIRDPLKLLFAWRDAYTFDRHTRRTYFTLLQGTRLRDALHALDLKSGGFASYAVFSAADFQAPHVRQAKTWLYVSERYTKEFEILTDAKQVDSGENVIVLIPFDDGVFYLRDGGTVGDIRMSSTNPVQTYVDLCHVGGRGEEAAEALLEQKLKPEWRAHGLSV